MIRATSAVLVIVIVAGFGGPAVAILPRPGGSGSLGGAATDYFAVRPGMVDVAEQPASVRAVGTAKALVILIDFVDKPADRAGNAPDYFQAKLFGQSQGSLRSYFDEVSYGRFSLTGDVVGWFRSACRHDLFVNKDGTPGTSDDYGLDISAGAIAPSLCAYPLNVWGLVKQAVELASQDIDLGQYDNDGPDGVPHSGDDDGFVDALFVIHAGIGAELRGQAPGSEDYIWSLQSNLDYYAPTRGTTFDGTRVGPFIIVPELGEIGVFAHEFCHLLGLPDLYNSLTGNSVVGPLCLMDLGAWLGPQADGSVPCHLSAPMKYILGWLEPEKVCLGCSEGRPYVDDAVIEPLGTSESAYTILDNPGGMDWTPEGNGTGEYFLLENRQKAYGRFEAYLPSSGMLIWKVDESQADNNTATARLADVIQADGEVMGSDGSVTDLPGEPSDFWPGTLGKREFTPYTVPSSSLRGGRFSGVAATDIRLDGAGRVTTDLMIGLPERGKNYAYPNPYSIDSLRAGKPLRIVFVPEVGPSQPYGFEAIIFDLEGKPVRHLNGDGETEAEGIALWDGRDESGDLVRPGLYIYVIKSSGEEATGTVAIKK